MTASESTPGSTQKVYAFLDHLIEGCQVIGYDMTYIYVNDTVVQHAHCSREELIGRTMWDCFPGIENTSIYSNIQTCMQDRVSMQLENEFTYPDGQIGWFDLRIDPVPEGVFILSLDITERKLTDKKNEVLQAQLIQAQKMESVGRLAGGVAHDFNNMLNVILGYAELALGRIDKGDQFFKEFSEIKTSANRAADLTRQLLGFARKQTILPKVLDLNETIDGMLSIIGRLIGENIELVWLPTENLWSVKMDPSQLDQILANLCVNARDAIDDVGKLVIETDRVTFDEKYCSQHIGFRPGEFSMIAVSDNGCGMDRDIVENIFEPFFTTKDIGKGTGLGLSMVYGVVKQNDGFVNVYSEPGQGATFKIYLPRFRGDDDKEQVGEVLKDVQCGQETVLLVEDEITLLHLVQAMLEELGYTVITSNTPAQALQLLEKHTQNIQLLMTDVIMPDMNGRDLAARAQKLRPHIKVLFTSGYTANVIAHHGVLDKDVNFLQKPFLIDDLATSVRKVLEDNGIQENPV